MCYRNQIEIEIEKLYKSVIYSANIALWLRCSAEML